MQRTLAYDCEFSYERYCEEVVQTEQRGCRGIVSKTRSRRLKDLLPTPVCRILEVVRAALYCRSSARTHSGKGNCRRLVEGSESGTAGRRCRDRYRRSKGTTKGTKDASFIIGWDQEVRYDLCHKGSCNSIRCSTQDSAHYKAACSESHASHCSYLLAGDQECLFTHVNASFVHVPLLPGPRSPWSLPPIAVGCVRELVCANDALGPLRPRDPLASASVRDEDDSGVPPLLGRRTLLPCDDEP
jgi:hypothetical protein